MNLLIVDDEVITVKGLMKGIDWHECGITGEVLVAYNAEQAKEVAEKKQIDVMLCDIEMPGENGLSLVSYVHKKHPSIACIFLTCHANFSYAQEAIHLCCEDYILKPAPYKDIQNAILRVTEELQIIRKDAQAMKYGKNWLKKQVEDAQDIQGYKRSPQEVVEETTSFILSNLSEEALSVTWLAKKMYLNEDYLNRIFKREKGLSLGKFIIQERMQLAANLLEMSNISIASIAAQVGYANYPHFISTFKKTYDCTPAQYRVEVSNKNNNLV